MQFIKKLFQNKIPEAPIVKTGSVSPPERMIRELLRENLNLVPVDVFYIKDPITGLNEADRKKYLKHFHELSKDRLLQERIGFLINQQAIKTLKFIKDTTGIFDTAGSANINGIATVKDDIERLATMHIKGQHVVEKFDPYRMFPD